MKRLVPAVALAAALTATPAAAAVQCFLEASAAKNITQTEVSDAFGPVTLAADGLAGGLGFGCDLALDMATGAGFGTPVIGVLARYDWNDIKTTIGSDTMSGDATWMVAARAGIKINPSVLAYVLGGVAGTSLSYAGLETDPQGILMGAGLEIDIAVKNLTVFAEWNRIEWDKSHVGGTETIEPATDAFRLGFRLKLDLTGGK